MQPPLQVKGVLTHLIFSCNFLIYNLLAVVDWWMSSMSMYEPAWPHNKGEKSVTANQELRKSISLNWRAVKSFYCQRYRDSNSTDITETVQCWGWCFDWQRKQTILIILFWVFVDCEGCMAANSKCQIFSYMFEKRDLLQTKTVVVKFFWLL